MGADGKAPVERHGYGLLRHRAQLPSGQLRGAVDHISGCGWHDCNDRYFIGREHMADRIQDYLLIYTLEGCGEASISGEKYRLTPDTIMIFPPGKGHSYGVPSGGRWQFYWMHVNGIHCRAMLEYIVEEYGKLNLVSCADAVSSCMEKLINSAFRYYEYELYAARCVSDLLFDLLADLTGARQAERKHESGVLKAIEYIEENSSERLSVREIASQLYLSPEHLIRIFRKETGMTPHQYIRRLRMKRACIYLAESDMSVEEITRHVGYRSSSSFIALFREQYGMTPRAYRSAHMRNENHSNS